MKSTAFYLILLLGCAFCSGASIGDGPVTGVEDVAETVPTEEALEGAEPVLPPEMPVAEQLIGDDPQQMVVDEVMGEQIVAEASPLTAEEIPGQEEVMDMKSAQAAELVAEEDLLKALDSVLANDETIADVVVSEAAEEAVNPVAV